MRGDEGRQGRTPVLARTDGHALRVVCPQCAARNPDHHAFCHRCAAPLAMRTEEIDPALVLIPVMGAAIGGESVEPVPAAPDDLHVAPPIAPPRRPLPHRLAAALPETGALRRILLGVEVAMVAAFTGVPATRDAFTAGGQQAVTAIRRAVWPTYTVVPAYSDVASDPAVHTAADALDGDTDTYWQGWMGAGAPPALHVSLDNRSDIAYVGVTGTTAHTTAPPTVSPRQLRLEFSNGTAQDVSLGAQRGFQAVHVSATGVEWVNVVVLSTWGTASPAVAIGEVEFFTQE